MNPEHHAKTLAALDFLMDHVSEIAETIMKHRKVFSDLMAPPGITYYRSGYWVFPEQGTLQEKNDARQLNYKWLIVSANKITSEIRHDGRVYECCGLEGPPPDAEDIIRCRPSAVEGEWHTDPDNLEQWRVFFLLVEELP